jgi:hypothetical protein
VWDDLLRRQAASSERLRKVEASKVIHHDDFDFTVTLTLIESSKMSFPFCIRVVSDDQSTQFVLTKRRHGWNGVAFSIVAVGSLHILL